MKHIELKDVEFSYDNERNAVNKVSFSIEKGSYTTIIGHNGSGKSTIAKLIIGLLARKSGDIHVCGYELNLENLQEIRSRVGIVFQNPDNQFIGSTVRDDIAFGLENHLVDPSLMDDIINEYSKRVNMQDFLEHEPTHLSGGQKQRVAIAGVLAMAPEILIFDESTSMLDPQGKEEINQMIRMLHTESDMTLISITHDIEEVVKSDYVIVMDDGKIVMDGKPDDVLVKEKELISLRLDIPFSVRLNNELKKSGIEIQEKFSLEGMVEELCQYRSKG